MTTDKEPSWQPLALLAIVIGAVMFVFPLCIPMPLLDPDEGLHASIAQEMMERGNWITPSFLGEPFFDKPILYFWAQIVSLRLFGESEAAVRLPGLMFGLLGAVTTGLLAWRLFGRTVGLIAGVLYSTTILPTALAQAAAHDVALIPWVNLAILLLLESERIGNRLRPALCIVGTGLFVGLSILTKGLLGVAVVGLAYGGYCLIRIFVHRGDSFVGGNVFACLLRLSIRGTVVLGVAVLIAAPWYLAVDAQHPGFLRYYFIERHVLGFATNTQLHSNQQWWYYLPILLGGGLPWIGYLGAARNKAQQVCRDSGVSTFPLLWFWLIGWTVFLTLARSKLATYLWPAFPPLAILAAVAWTRMIVGSLSDNARRSFGRTFVGSSLGGPIILPAVALIVERSYAADFSWLVWAGVAVVALASPLPIVPWRAGRRTASLAAAVLSVAAQFVVAMALVMPSVGGQLSACDLADHFNRQQKIPSRVLVAEERIGSLVFYLDPRLRAGLREGQFEAINAKSEMQPRPGDTIVVPERRVRKAGKYLDLDGAAYEQVGRYRLYRDVKRKPRDAGE